MTAAGARAPSLPLGEPSGDPARGPSLGLLVFVGSDPQVPAARSLQDGIGLFQHAEALGLSSARVRVRHHSPTLSAPFPFLAAAAQHTRSLRLGTAVLPLGHQDVLSLAEDAATTDLLSGGRLELGVSSGALAPPDGGDREVVVAEELQALRSALEGGVLGEPYALRLARAPGPDRPAPPPPGQRAPAPGSTAEVTVEFVDPQPRPAGPVATPCSPGLAGRLWAGAGSLSSALRAARAGYGLLLSTLNTEFVADVGGLGGAQARLVEAYRAEVARLRPGDRGRVAVSRSVLPLVDAGDRAAYGHLVERYRPLVDAEGRFFGTPPSTQWSPLYGGSPEEVVDALSRDPSVALADEVLLTPVSDLDLPSLHRVVEATAQEVAPRLGWRLDVSTAAAASS